MRCPRNRPHRSRAALAVLSMLLLSCGGGDSPTPPGTDDPGQRVVVNVSTTGTDVDADGYTVRLGSRTATVAATGTATFDDVPPGSYDVRLDGVALNCLVEGSAVQTVSVTSSSGASASFSVDCAVDFGDETPTVACPELSFSASSARPAEHVAVGPRPAGLGTPLAARVLDQNGEDVGYAWFEGDGQGGLELVTPLHPAGRADGGDVWIRISDGGAACAPVPFTIEAMPAAPGELARSIDALQEILRAQAEILETTPEALQAADVDEVEAALLPLWTVQWVLDHPDNERSLRAVAAGSAPEPVPLDVVEAILAHVGFVDILATPSAPQAPSASSPLATVTAAQCTPAAIGTDGDKLAQCMLAVGDIDAKLQGYVNQLPGAIRTIIQQWHLVQQAQGLAQGVLTGVIWAGLQQDAELYAALPSVLDDAQLRVNPPSYSEDNDRIGVWRLDVEAHSLGWDATETALENLTDAAIRAALDALNVQTPSVRTTILTLLGNRVAAALQNRPIPREDFGPVEMTGDTWSEAEYRPKAGGALSVDGVSGNHHHYQPIVAGTTVLTVTTPKPGGQNYGAPVLTAETDLVVDSIVIRVMPSDTFVAPDATNVPFRVVLEGAQHPDSTKITIEQGSHGPPQYGPAPAFLLEYTPPPSPDFNDPDSIHVEYIGKTGPVATAPKRFGFAIVRFGEIDITPMPACLDTLEQQAFSAEVKGLTNQDVDWSAAAGSIDDGGNYQAPRTRPATGVDTIRATSVEEPELVGEVVVPIGCTCNFRVRVGSQVITPVPGDWMVFNTQNGRLWGVSATSPSRGWNIDLLPVDENPGSRPNAPGIWPMVIQGDMGLSPPDVIYATDPPPPAILDLGVLVPNQRVQGTVAGPVELVTSNPRPLDVDWFFAIRYAPGEFTCTVQ